MRCGKVAVFLSLLTFTCAQPLVPSSTNGVCETVSCPDGYYCNNIDGIGTCMRMSIDPEGCSMDCGENQQCRFGACITADVSGKVCEFDDACPTDEFCIAGYCTRLECFPGDILPCYNGATGTAGIGACVPGVHTCTNQGTYTQECFGEVIPREEVGFLACNGIDDNCDGITDSGDLRELDIVFGFDISGSMTSFLAATNEAISQIAAMYDSPEILLSLVLFPNSAGERAQLPAVVIPLESYEDFVYDVAIELIGMRAFGGEEASWDLPYLVATNTLEGLHLRESAATILIMFTDEGGQSYMDLDEDGCQYDNHNTCDITEEEMCEAVEENDLRLYFIVDEEAEVIDWEAERDSTVRYPVEEDFDDCSTIFYLSTDADEMTDNLTELSEHICE